mmetsp:Transcript_87797/g.248674  ORF Transcript_87797/g.248674 Transcript_87797/m.248674 type:complete len:278 (-) Transcript_87797:622-1455(-)
MLSRNPQLHALEPIQDRPALLHEHEELRRLICLRAHDSFHELFDIYAAAPVVVQQLEHLLELVQADDVLHRLLDVGGGARELLEVHEAVVARVQGLEEALQLRHHVLFPHGLPRLFCLLILVGGPKGGLDHDRRHDVHQGNGTKQNKNQEVEGQPKVRRYQRPVNCRHTVEGHELHQRDHGIPDGVKVATSLRIVGTLGRVVQDCFHSYDGENVDDNNHEHCRPEHWQHGVHQTLDEHPQGAELDEHPHGPREAEEPNHLQHVNVVHHTRCCVTTKS